MILRQDFTADFDAITAVLRPDYDGPQIAFSRFGDGEMRIIDGQPHRASIDGWAWEPEDNRSFPLSRLLEASLRFSDENYYVGLPCGCCIEELHRKAVDMAGVPRQQQTFANLFVNANYRRWRKVDKSYCCIVSGHDGDAVDCRVPLTPQEWSFSEVVSAARWLVLNATGPILVSCGPMACGLIQQYWSMTSGSLKPRRQTIMDAGSANDYLFGRERSRLFARRSRKGMQRRKQVCTWGND